MNKLERTETKTRDIPEGWVQVAAYHIWQKEGCPHGRHVDHWLQAKVELEKLSDVAEARPAKKTRAPQSAKPKPKRATKTSRSLTH